MVIYLGFTLNREVINFKVEDKVITYYDKKWTLGIQFMPKDKDLIKKLTFCRNRIPYAQKIMQWIQESNTGKNFKEYQAAKDDEELAEIIKKDAKSKGLLEIKVKKK